MNKNTLEYKGYYTKIEYSADDHVLYGKIEGITDLVNFECDNSKDIEKEFHNAVDDYLAFCKDLGQDPEKSYKGVFNVRISPELHKKAVIAASKRGESLNAFVGQAINDALSEKNAIVYVIPTHEMPQINYNYTITRQSVGEVNYAS